MNVFLLSILTWIIFIPLAIGNGILREKGYKEHVGDLAAHQVSTVIASIAYVILAHFMLQGVISSVDTVGLLLIGLLWVLMTISFEFGFGHYVDKAPWERLLADYNLFAGRVWALFLLIIFITPFLVKFLSSPM